MPAKKIVSKAKKVSKVKSKLVSKVKKSTSKSSLPKVKLKSGQPVLVRRSIMYIFVSSLVLLFLINAFPAAIAGIFYSDTSSSVLGENDIKAKRNNGKNLGKGDMFPEDEKEIEPTPAISTTPNPRPTKTELPKPSKAYDAQGNVVEKKQINLKGDSVDIKAKTFGETGVDSSYQFKDKNGSVVMLKVRESDGSWSHLLYNEKNGMLLVKQKDSASSTPSLTPKPTMVVTLGVTPEDTIEVTKGERPTPIPTVAEEPTSDSLAIKINTGGSFDLIKHGVTASTNLPVEVDGNEGKVYVNNTLLNVNPDQAVSEAKKSKGLDSVDAVTVTKENGVTTYMIKGVDNKKFLGLFDVTLPKTLYYTVDTNTLVSESKTTMQTLLDAFSF